MSFWDTLNVKKSDTNRYFARRGWEEAKNAIKCDPLMGYTMVEQNFKRVLLETAFFNLVDTI